MIRIERYTERLKVIWNSFINESNNATFLLTREYIDYHKLRFIDHSILFYKDNILVAVLPASEHGAEIRSHGGLTYGGIIYSDKMNISIMIEIIFETASYYTKHGFKLLLYKEIPQIYHKHPTGLEAYVLFRFDAKLISRSPSSFILLSEYQFPNKKMNGVRKALKNGLNVKIISSSAEIMNLVDANLRMRYQISAVHSVDEMEILSASFPSNIKIFNLYAEDLTHIGGAVIYESEMVAHSQYLVVNEIARVHRGMDLLIFSIVNFYSQRKKYFDFGISSEQNGMKLNESLYKQKSEYGSWIVNYDHYRINFDDVLINFRKQIIA